MKTVNLVLLAAGLFLVFACKDGDQMLTRINDDGSCYREFNARADSSFMVGDTAKSKPFPLDLDSTWHITWQYGTPQIHTNWPLKTWQKDTAHKDAKVMVWAKRNFKSVDDMASSFKLSKNHKWASMKPTYSLDKKFRWFYTYYTYRETYPKIKTLDRVPIEKYITPENAEFWFNGNLNLLKGMNGIEINDFTKKIENQYNLWFAYNLWEEEYDVLLDNYNLLEGLKVSKEQLKEAKDSVFQKYFNIDQMDASKVNDFTECLDKYFKTTAFSKLLKKEDNPLSKFEDSFNNRDFINYFSTSFNYKLIMPGKLLQSRNAKVSGDTLNWNLTAYRMVYKDFVISAQSRKANTWAFILSGLIVLLAIGSFIFKK